MEHIKDLLVSQLSLAGEIVKLKYQQGINASIYFMGSQDGEPGLIKMLDLFYRGDNIVSSRAPRIFYSLKDGAVILDAARGKAPVFQDVTNNPMNENLSWVYAYPMLDYRNEVMAVICLSGSARELTDEFQKDLHVVATNLAKNLDIIFKEADIPGIWKDTLLKL
jgi:hypothetical protein